MLHEVEFQEPNGQLKKSPPTTDVRTRRASLTESFLGICLVEARGRGVAGRGGERGQTHVSFERRQPQGHKRGLVTRPGASRAEWRCLLLRAVGGSWGMVRLERGNWEEVTGGGWWGRGGVQGPDHSLWSQVQGPGDNREPANVRVVVTQLF